MFKFLTDKDWLAVCIAALALTISLATFIHSLAKDRRHLARERKRDQEDAEQQKPEISLNRVRRTRDEDADWDEQSPTYLKHGKVLLGWNIYIWLCIRNRGKNKIYLNEITCSLPDIPGATFRLDVTKARKLIPSDDAATLKPEIQWLEPGKQSLMTIEAQIPKDASSTQTVFSVLMLDVEARFLSEGEEPPLEIRRRLRLPESA